MCELVFLCCFADRVEHHDDNASEQRSPSRNRAPDNNLSTCITREIRWHENFEERISHFESITALNKWNEQEKTL